MNKSGQSLRPTTEEILASIRRAIREDQCFGAAASESTDRDVEHGNQPCFAAQPNKAKTMDGGQAGPVAAMAGQHRESGGQARHDSSSGDVVARLQQLASRKKPVPSDSHPYTTPSNGASPNHIRPSPPQHERDHDRQRPYQSSVINPVAQATAGVMSYADSVTASPGYLKDGASVLSRATEADDALPKSAERNADLAVGVDKPSAKVESGSGPLVDDDTGASIAAAFDELSAIVASRLNDKMIEQVVHELMQPMLKLWLEQNLPGIVERLVGGEIERISRRTR